MFKIYNNLYCVVFAYVCLFLCGSVFNGFKLHYIYTLTRLSVQADASWNSWKPPPVKSWVFLQPHL